MPLLDIHVHTSRYSPCSLIEAEELLQAAAGRGLDGLVITEHGRVWPEGELAELGRRWGGRLVLLAGQEVRTTAGGLLSGDVLVFGSPRVFPRNVSAEVLIEAVHRDGGVAVAAHPYRRGLGLGDRVHHLPLDGLEVLSGNAAGPENEEARRASLARGLPALGGSDAHQIGQVGLYATEFQGEVGSMEDLIALIREGKCRPVKP